MRRRPMGLIIPVLIAALLFAAAALVYMKAEQTRKTYQAEAVVTPAPTLAPPQLYARPTEALLRTGSVGTEVAGLQQRLKELGYYTGEIDGHFGSGTKAALVLFQQQHGLDPDGMAGSQTLQMISSDAARQMTVTPKPALPAFEGQLPLLVNRSKALAADYQPPELVALRDVVPKGLMILKDQNVRASRPAVEALVGMIRAAEAAGLSDWQVSEGYRSYERQQQLFDAQLKQFKEEDQMSEQAALKATEQMVARPGTSEHHTGLAFDLTVPNHFFGDTPQAQWLAQHCWEHGFILRYTLNKQDITGYAPEPWHVRYVGQPHAGFMREHDLALEEYLALF